MKYNIVTYGCQMNVHESEKLAGMLNASGYNNTTDIKDADVIIFNTCSIREGAVKRLKGNIGALKKLKENKKDTIIAICGCATQNKKDAEFIYNKFPFVDIIFGTHNIHRLPELITLRKDTGKHILEIWDNESDEFFDVPILRSDKISANINIMYGCNNFCSYCIVPYVRGRERSRPFDDIINEAASLINNGTKEITLLGQNVNSYGNDINDGNVSFAHLLKTLSEINGKFRIKFMTSHPKDLSDEVIDVIKNSRTLNKHIHLPVQSGSNQVLQAMNRKYTREKYLKLTDKIKSEIPNISITSDIIVGFPGETEADFLDTVSLIKEVRYSNIYAFKFSPRYGTAAYSMKDNLSDGEKSARLTSLIETQKSISKEIAKTKLNREYEVLCVNDNGNNPVALTESDEVINLDNYKIGEFMRVKVASVKNSRLFGEII